MRWFRERPTPVLAALMAKDVSVLGMKYRATVPLYGDWEILRLVASPGGVTGRNKFSGFGVRLATDVPTTTAEWQAAERLWYGDSEGDYLGDGVVAPGEEALTVAGPFRISPRGRRLVVRFNHTQSGSQVMAITFVLHQL